MDASVGRYPPVVLPLAIAIEAVTLPVEERFGDDGLRVLVHEDRRGPLVAVAVVYEAGSARDPEGRRGLAHLVEHLAFPGGEAGYDASLARVGAASNAWTEPDLTALYAWGPREALGLLLDLEADRMVGWGFSEEDLARERAVVLQEQRQTWSADRAWARRALDAALWPPGHPYHHPVLGSASELEAVTLEEALDHAARWLVPSRATLVIAGDVVAEEVFAALEGRFGLLPAGEAAPPFEVPAARSGRWYVEHGRAHPELRVAWPIGAEEAELAELLAEVLDGRLERRERGRVLEAGASAWSGRLGGVLSLELEVEAGTARAARLLEREVRRVARRGVPDEELRRAALALWREEVEELETVEGRATRLGWCAAQRGDPGCTPARVRAWLTAEPADLAAFAGALSEREPTIVHLGEPLGRILELP